tara:strand:+ start:300 stop:617 length:318 start_codon:yes stop_codon:yes gene_type:complete
MLIDNDCIKNESIAYKKISELVYATNLKGKEVVLIILAITNVGEVIKYFDLPAILISLLYSIPFLLKPANPNSALINGELLLFDKMISLTSLSNRENSALSTIKS